MPRDELITENLGLVHSCANRFRNKGIEYDDLYGAGCVGLVKAAKGFDETLGFAFSTYAVPAILGEIRRLFRDGGAVKVSRSLKEKARTVLREKEILSKELGVEPTVSEIAERLQMETSEVAELLVVAMPVVSLTATEDGDSDKQLDVPVASEENNITDRIALDEVLSTLSERDKKLIKLRYYSGLSQTVTAQHLGMSQVQVSRTEKKILLEMRKRLTG